MRKISVFIGRFQPFHRGHYKVVQKALSQTDFLIMVLGSDQKAINTRDPLTTEERISIIQKSLTAEERARTYFVAVQDYEYSLDRWIAGVQTAVRNARLPWTGEPIQYYLIGMQKDHTSFYLNLFPNWKSIPVAPVDDPRHIISASDIRADHYQMVMKDEKEWLKQFVNMEAFLEFSDIMSDKPIMNDYKYEQEYEGKWGKGPHLTVDSAVVQAGYILLIQRGREYGYGRWALPGGFVNPDETTMEASLRELEEETKIKVPKKVLRGSLVKSKLYDAPHRSNRSRIVTHTFYYRLTDVGDLPRVKGSDDAMKAKWIPISQFMGQRQVMFEDHYDMITDILGL